MSSSPRDTNSSPTTSFTQRMSSEGLGSLNRLSSEEGQKAVNGNEELTPTILTLRAVISSKEAGVIIGKGGANVARLREKSGVKAGVSKVIPGVNHRILTVVGPLEGVATAFSLIAATILENPAVPGLSFNGSLGSVEGQATIHLLISHALMGTVIGRQGLKIKHIQDLAGVKMVASKEMLPSSTERSVEVQGTAQGIETAVTEIGRCLLQDWERGQGTILYQPSPSSAGGRSLVAGARGGLLVGKQRVSTTIGVPRTLLNGTNVHQGGQTMSYKTLLANGRVASSAAAVTSGGELVAPMHDGATIPAQVIEGDIAVQNIGIPSDMVGCIIGKGGSKISEIRRISGSQISIAKMPHDESGERMFTIQGPVESNEKALFYLYNSLEAEKQKRAEAAAADAASNVSVVGGSIGGQQVVGA